MKISKLGFLLICSLLLAVACNDDEPNTPNEDPNNELPNIVINEFLASNLSCCPDPDGVDEYDDWVELYNAGNEAVDIGGYFVSDNRTNPKKFMIPTNAPNATTIPAGGYLVLWADNQPEQGPLHLNFALSADGESIGIYAPDARVIDEYVFPAQTTDVSTGRSPDGANNWVTFTSPTPGASNQ